MPIKTSSLNIKAFPLEVINKEQNEKTSQILSPSSILPTTALFMLHITTEAALKLSYKINVKQSNNLMQKSALFYDLSTQYTDYASQSSFNLTGDNNTSSDFINDSSLKELTQEADGLPILCIELPNISIEIIDSLLQWLFNNDEVKFDDILTSTLASNIKSTLDFFGLLNFATLLNLNEPYCSIIDEILVWYYFGLSVQERNQKIIKNESFINGNIPARFVKRLAESVDEVEEKQILSNFFRSSDEISKDNEWETLSLTTGDIGSNLSENSKSDILEWLNSSSVITPTPRRVTFSLPNSPSPLDTAEPPTPLGSAYFCISPPPNTPSSPAFKRIIPRSLPRTPKTTTFTKSIILPPSIISSINEKDFLERDDILEDVPLTAGLTVPPNTPNLLLNNSYISAVNSKMISKSPNTLVPPNTPISPENIMVPPNTPNSSISSVFYSPLAPPNTPNTPFSPISSSSYHSAITINGLLSPTSPPSPITVPPNTPTSPFIFQSIINNINNNNNSNDNIMMNIGSSFNINSNNRKFPRKNSRDRNVTIDSVLANSLNNLY
ncbi:hypothetical protein RhiirA1_448638 [Rhizophagus irregularis]|uniref:Uncharacterized protein n=2 Tax=Rhizophagus irregularis TaxID=588596 RepID=A0A2I1DT78_9GLOM|nr:hypothetical protein RhiirA1_448638 [Rhizophagus irregularis]PKK80423.1 hypothetical protein RhiirC2_704221 [Rhizophagus irregularis]PKY13039.1 hypothetical protein RhiirB3_465164 [Rhizophagus irregularis]CAB4374364.1 unnamed protein product [Rhizophagus irregularis]CAB4484959.1 unnamed protein product [Rhizophagus irregularis]